MSLCHLHWSDTRVKMAQKKNCSLLWVEEPLQSKAPLKLVSHYRNVMLLLLMIIRLVRRWSPQQRLVFDINTFIAIYSVVFQISPNICPKQKGRDDPLRKESLLRTHTHTHKHNPPPSPNRMIF